MAMHLLMDYRFIPTDLTPKQKKIEIVKAIMKSFTNKYSKYEDIRFLRF